jgi:hypothetical protein
MGRVMGTRALVHTGAGVVALCVLTHARPASAADIASILGEPGEATFGVECPNGTIPDDVDDGIPTCPIGIGGVIEADCLHRVDIDITAYPNAVCSDGTAASFYVRPYSDNDDEHRWVIHLQGGGGCTDEATCRERWCGDNGFYTAALMSNDWNANGLVDRPSQAWVLGISSNVPSNDFATWNHVYIPYCTSDLWLGRQHDVDLGAFSVDSDGHRLLQAVRNMLRQLGPAWTPEGFGDYPMPVLEDDAETEILFTGTSAGGYGVVQNGDWFLDKFPSARTGLVIDAIADPGPLVIEDFGLWDETSDQPWDDRRLELWEEMWEPGGWWYESDAFVDESCRAHYELGLGLQYCMSPTRVLRSQTIFPFGSTPFIETPSFMRVALEDQLLSGWVIGSNLDGTNPDGDLVTVGDGGPAPTLQQYTEMMRETAVALNADLESDITVFAPRCAQHVGLEHGNAFGGWTTDDTSDALPRVPGNIPETFRDALFEWFNPGGAFVRVRRIDTDEVDAFGNPIDYSSCP